MGSAIFQKVSLGQLVGVALAVAYCLIIEVWLGWGAVLAPLLGLPTMLLVQMLALLGLTYIVRALRLYSYFLGDLRRRFGLTLAIMLTHNLFNHLLPARLGEASLPFLLKRHLKVDLLRGTSALLWFRFLDLHTLLSFALLAAVFSPGSLPLMDFADLLDGSFGSALLFAIGLFLLTPMAIFLLMRHYTYPPAEQRSGWQSVLFRVLSGLPERSTDFWLSWIWTGLTWLIKLLTLAWLLANLLSISWPAALLGVSGGELTAVLPVHAPGGFGTYAGGIVAALTPLNIDLDASLIAAANTHLVLFAAALVSGLAGWLLLQQDYKK
ncbi:MAG TPA: hypothetical protein DHU16_07170 [Gammaproteobacteria bacterium]|nr:hypothetical protein [Gammaproteobacteria bacterium]